MPGQHRSCNGLVGFISGIAGWLAGWGIVCCRNCILRRYGYWGWEVAIKVKVIFVSGPEICFLLGVYSSRRGMGCYLCLVVLKLVVGGWLYFMISACGLVFIFIFIFVLFIFYLIIYPVRFLTSFSLFFYYDSLISFLASNAWPVYLLASTDWFICFITLWYRIQD